MIQSRTGPRPAQSSVAPGGSIIQHGISALLVPWYRKYLPGASVFGSPYFKLSEVQYVRDGGF